jgi:hypothetical protein
MRLNFSCHQVTATTKLLLLLLLLIIIIIIIIITTIIIIPRNEVLLEKLIVAQLLRILWNPNVHYRVKTAHHCFLPCAR